jgi:adenylate cyclase
MRVFGFGPSTINRRICRHCIDALEKNPGGAEVEISLLFADVRGATRLAERASAGEFSQLMARFYGTAAKVVDARNGIVDKFVGDQAMALFIPGFAGAARPGRRRGGTGAPDRDGSRRRNPWVPVGAGVHTGVAYVGTIGEGDALDFTALGDSVNSAARLASSAGVGEILVSAAAASAAELDTTGLEQRTLTLRGRTEVVEAWVTTLGAPSRQEELAPVG